MVQSVVLLSQHQCFEFQCFDIVGYVTGRAYSLLQLSTKIFLSGVCGRGVGNNSIQCSSFQKWVHKKCSGIM